MAKIESFERHLLEYENWFSANRFAYISELLAVKKQLPKVGSSVEIGVGTGRFAAPLGIDMGVEPSKRMGAIASQRGVQVVAGTGEELPLGDALFDDVLMVTTLCFLDNAKAALAEAFRILRTGGHIIIGFVDKDSPLGIQYQENKEKSSFYKVAVFYSASEVEELLRQTGFGDISFFQTIFRNLSEIDRPERVKPGFGEGSFLVGKGSK